MTHCRRSILCWLIALCRICYGFIYFIWIYIIEILCEHYKKYAILHKLH